MLKNICVYCGSNKGNRPEYVAAAKELANTLVQRELGLIYGGASVGIMGILADEVLQLGGRVTGVMPQSLIEKEVGHNHLTHMHIVSSMHERKSKMAELSDGFIALPGGLGTLEEVFEVLTWGQLGFHSKPCALLNVCDYYQHLSTFLQHCLAEGFLMQAHLDALIIESSSSAIIERFESYTYAYQGKWA